jgi:hypothetical protein
MSVCVLSVAIGRRSSLSSFLCVHSSGVINRAETHRHDAAQGIHTTHTTRRVDEVCFVILV